MARGAAAQLSDLVCDAPSVPGVYLFSGADGELLYVGKAKDLRARLRSYTHAGAHGRLVSAVRSVRWELCASDARAAARETDLIRALRPPFNDALTDRSEYLFITVSDAGRGRVRFAMNTDPDGDRAYGCFPYAARVTDAFPALIRLLCQGERTPSRIMRATGCVIALGEDLRPAVHPLLSGRSPRLLDLIAARLPSGGLHGRAAARDLETVRTFYADGPRAVRRLRLRHGVGSGPVSSSRLCELIAADLGVDVRRRDDLEERIAAMAASGMDRRAIASVLNSDGVPRFDGARWGFWDIDRIVRRRYP